MGVDIQKHSQRPLVRQVVSHIALDELNFRASIRLLRFSFILGEKVPVHIFALQVSPVVADDYAVRVNDGKDPPFKLLSELLGIEVARKKEVDDSVNNKAGVGLAGVLAPDYHNYGFGCVSHYLTVFP